MPRLNAWKVNVVFGMPQLGPLAKVYKRIERTGYFLIMQTVTIIGIIASTCTAVSLLPQLIKIIKEKQPSDISYWVLIILILGLICWVIYGVMAKDPIIIIANAVSLIINSTLATLNVLYKRKRSNS